MCASAVEVRPGLFVSSRPTESVFVTPRLVRCAGCDATHRAIGHGWLTVSDRAYYLECQGARATAEWEARQMIAEMDRTPAMVERLNDFERECLNEAVAAISTAAEFPTDSGKRFDALNLSHEWLNRARLLRDVVAILEAKASTQAEPPCACGTGADYRFDPGCPHHSGLRAAALARLQSTEPTL